MDDWCVFYEISCCFMCIYTYHNSCCIWIIIFNFSTAAPFSNLTKHHHSCVKTLKESRKILPILKIKICILFVFNYDDTLYEAGNEKEKLKEKKNKKKKKIAKYLQFFFYFLILKKTTLWERLHVDDIFIMLFMLEIKEKCKDRKKMYHFWGSCFLKKNKNFAGLFYCERLVSFWCMTMFFKKHSLFSLSLSKRIIN